MGRGNWFPGNSPEDCEVVYIRLPGSEDDADDLTEWHWNDFKQVLRASLSRSWDTGPTWDEIYSRFDGVGRDDQPLAFNGLYGLFFDSGSDKWHMGIGMRVRADAPSFARSRLRETAERLWDRLAEHYELSVRTSAWTSSPRKVT